MLLATTPTGFCRYCSSPRTSRSSASCRRTVTRGGIAGTCLSAGGCRMAVITLGAPRKRRVGCPVPDLDEECPERLQFGREKSASQKMTGTCNRAGTVASNVELRLQMRGTTMSVKKVALVTGSGKRRVGVHVAEALAGRGSSLGGY